LGLDIGNAKVGDPLALRFEVLDSLFDSPFEIFVRDLVASDGVEASEIRLIDDKGQSHIVITC